MPGGGKPIPECTNAEIRAFLIAGTIIAGAFGFSTFYVKWPEWLRWLERLFCVVWLAGLWSQALREFRRRRRGEAPQDSTARSSGINPMKPKDISPGDMLRFAVGRIVVSALAALAFLLGRQYAVVRGTSGGLGIPAALIGGGVAAWFSIRARNRSLLIAALLSILPLACWGWMIYEHVHVYFR
jgi:hypothetical protein